MAQFSVNATRYDPYKNFKFRVKWDGRYVAGISKVGAFMHDRFRQGAFQGITPRDAYFVKCDAETTTQSDIDRGIVNILVGFAPLKPAEFVVIRIQQMAGQLEA